MNKTRIVLAATGGVIGLVVLVMAYFTWGAFARKAAAFEGDDEKEGLETYVGRVSSLIGKKPYPSMANKKMMDENCKAFGEFRSELRHAASAGDWRPDAAITPAQFKEALVREARLIADGSGTADGKFMKPDFSFGPFKEYLADKLPSKAELARLQRQWYDITSLCEVLRTNGVHQVTDLQVVERKDSVAQDKAAAGKMGGGKGKAVKSEREVPWQSVETYKISFQGNPTNLVNVVRTLSFRERFTVVDGMTFSRVRDAIAESLGGGKEKSERASASSGRRSRRRPAVEPRKDEEEKQASKDKSVFDPKTDSVLQVELTVSVYDFGTLADEKEEAK